MKKTFYIKTYGCQMNEYDSTRISDLLCAKLAMEPTNNPAKADLIILNTCSIREKAQEKVFSDLGRYREIKKSNPHLMIAVGGCVATQEGKNIIKRAPYVNIVFGPQTLHRLPQLYHEALINKKSAIDISQPQIEKFSCLPNPRPITATAFVSIMEGCNKYCSYCVVPFTRGKEISRPLADVINECHQLAEQGVKEITFLGQNVNDYRGEITDNKIATLADLIKASAKITNIARIRFTTSYPSSFSDELIAVYANEPKLVNHLHLPVQSGSNRILKLMRRKYTREEYIEIINKLRKVRPNISISSDFIVGFPGETEEDFQQTMELVKEVNFDHSFSFIYSKRPGTLAANMLDDISLKEKKRRLSLLQEQLIKQTNIYSERMLNSVQNVLVTAVAKKGRDQLSGRTENNRVVNFSGDISLIGNIVQIRITNTLPNSLQGAILSDRA